MSTTTNPTPLSDVIVAQSELSDAAHKYRMASVRRRYAIRRAVAAGATHQEVADVLGISRVKVTRLVNNNEEETDQ